METEIIQRPEKPRDLGTTVDTPTGDKISKPHGTQRITAARATTKEDDE